MISRRGVLAATLALPFVRAAHADGPLQYYSDYISFAGGDDRGRIFFALDTNRGRDGDAYQAEHFAEYYADGDGFLPLHGEGKYDNEKKQLAEIPSSFYFRFGGTPETGLTVTSPLNAMFLEIEPLSKQYVDNPENGFFWIGAAAAELTVDGRTVAGRVIFESLFFDGWNRLARKYGRLWNNFNGLYLRTDGGRDFYMHSSEAENPRTAPVSGLATWGEPGAISNIDFQITGTEKPEEGEFLWPVAWKIGFDHGGKAYILDARSTAKDVIWGGGTNGFMMAVVEGEIRSMDDSEIIKVDGWAELLI